MWERSIFWDFGIIVGGGHILRSRHSRGGTFWDSVIIEWAGAEDSAIIGGAHSYGGAIIGGAHSYGAGIIGGAHSNAICRNRAGVSNPTHHNPKNLYLK